MHTCAKFPIWTGIRSHEGHHFVGNVGPANGIA